MTQDNLLLHMQHEVSYGNRAAVGYGGSLMFLQLSHELSHRMMEVAGFNQPPEFPAQDFIKR